MSLKLIIGNKNYSSWSMRPCIALKVASIPFEETVISLDAPNFKQVVGSASSSRKVPVMIDGDIRGWYSRAILKYLEDRVRRARLRPTTSAARAIGSVRTT